MGCRAVAVAQGMLLFGGTFQDSSQQDSCFLLRIDAQGRPTSWVQFAPDIALPHPIGMHSASHPCQLPGMPRFGMDLDLDLPYLLGSELVTRNSMVDA